MKVADDYQKIVFNFDIDKNIDGFDLPRLAKIVNGIDTLRNYSIQAETGIDISKILEDKETGKLYFIEEKVSEEEAKELEKYGVNRTMLGDLDLNGKLTQEDLDIMCQKAAGTIDLNNIQKIIGDFNGEGFVDGIDVPILSFKLSGIIIE